MSPSGPPGVSQILEKPSFRHWSGPVAVLLLLLLALLSFACVILIFPFLIPRSPRLDVALHSLLFADYRAELTAMQIPSVGLGLVEELIEESDPEGASSRIATLVSGMHTPVPTATWQPGKTSTIPPKTYTPTGTAGPAVFTAAVTSILSITRTKTAILTEMATSTSASTARPTYIIPSRTPTRQPTGVDPSPIPTVRPTISPQPSPTRIPSPTQTLTPAPYLPPATPYP